MVMDVFEVTIDGLGEILEVVVFILKEISDVGELFEPVFFNVDWLIEVWSTKF